MFGYNFYFNYVEPHVPRGLHGALRSTWRRLEGARNVLTFQGLSNRYFLWRIKPLPTRLLGPLWNRKGNIAELDITYSCNLKCFNCNRSCEQDPSNDGMSVGQVRRFLEESRMNGVQWRHLRVLGGEPTNHPHFLEIVNLILEYREKYFPKTRVIVVSNGHGDRVNRMLSLLPSNVEVENTAKTTKVQTAFNTFNVAPVDTKEYTGADFSNACSAVAVCGMGVTPYGYYPCAVAGAIDRTFGLNLGRKEMPKPGDSMKEELRKFCSLCGQFKPPTNLQLDGPVMSPTWSEAYTRSHESPPKLSRLPEAAGLVQISLASGDPISPALANSPSST